MNYISVILDIAPFKEDYAEQVIAQIEELGFESFEIQEPYLRAYITEQKFCAHNLKMILSYFDNNEEFQVSANTEFIKEENWNALWESNFSPIIVENLCTVKASFHKDLPSTKYNITIDPKMAFGTGHHQTTYLMMNALLKDKIKGLNVLDMGCGTGILSILSAKMGAKSPVCSIDIDEIAVESTIENSKKNRVSQKISALLGDASLLENRKFDLVLANINRNIILEDIGVYSSCLSVGGRIFLSGFYEEDIEAITKEAKKYNLQILSTKGRDKWAFIKLIKI